MHAAGKAYARHDGLGHPPLLEQCRGIIEPRVKTVVGITRRPSRHVSVVAVKLGSCRIGHAADEVDAMGRRLRKRESRFGKHTQVTMRVGDKRTVRQFGSRLDLALRVAKERVTLVEVFEVAVALYFSRRGKRASPLVTSLPAGRPPHSASSAALSTAHGSSKPQTPPQLRRRIGHEGGKEQRGDAARLQRIVEHERQLALGLLALGEIPRRAFLNVEIRAM